MIQFLNMVDELVRTVVERGGIVKIRLSWEASIWFDSLPFSDIISKIRKPIRWNFQLGVKSLPTINWQYSLLYIILYILSKYSFYFLLIIIIFFYNPFRSLYVYVVSWAVLVSIWEICFCTYSTELMMTTRNALGRMFHMQISSPLWSSQHSV